MPEDDSFIWPLVLQKAWAKLNGSYANSEGGWDGRILRKMTAGAKRAFHHHTMDLHTLLKTMHRPDNMKLFMSAGKNPH